MKNDEVFLGEPTLRQMNREIEALAARIEALAARVEALVARVEALCEPPMPEKGRAIAKAKVTREANKTNEEESADK